MVAAKKIPALELKDILPALDRRELNFYQSLTDIQKKSFSPLLMMRYMSAVPNYHDYQQYHIDVVNEWVNTNFWELSKHPELQHQLLCLCGTGKIQRHEWIPGSKKKVKNSVESFFKQAYPHNNDTELKIIFNQSSVDDFTNLVKEYGIQDKDMKLLVNDFKKMKNSG